MIQGDSNFPFQDNQGKNLHSEEDLNTLLLFRDKVGDALRFNQVKKGFEMGGSCNYQFEMDVIKHLEKYPIIET